MDGTAGPYRGYAEMRTSDPVSWNAETRAFWITRYADVAACLRNTSLSSAITPSTLYETPLPVFEFYAAILKRQMDLADAPRHTRLRSVIRQAFRPAQLDRLRGCAQQWVRDRLETLPSTFDLMKEIARPLPLFVISELIGVGAERMASLESAVITFVQGVRDPVATYELARGAVDAARIEIAAAIRHRDLPRGSLLAIAKDHMPDAIDADDLLANVILIIAAGHHTTTNLIGNGTWLFHAHGGPTALADAGATVLTTAIDESLRFESPVQSVRRIATGAIEIGGRNLHAGDELVLALGSANRDQDAFADADRFDLWRTPNPHLAFGAATHGCPGAQLAKLQAHAVLSALFDEPGITVIDQIPSWLPSSALRGLATLTVTRS